MKSIGRKAYFCPLPVVMIGTYDKNKKPDLMNAAWGTLCDYDKIVLTIDKTHKTLENIMETKALSIAFATKELVEICDYVGLVSQNKDPNKLDKVNLNIEESTNVFAPVFTDFPYTLECELVSYDYETEMLICRIVNTLAKEECLDESDKLDFSKMNIIAYNSLTHEYFELNTPIAKAFNCGKKLIGD